MLPLVLGRAFVNTLDARVDSGSIDGFAKTVLLIAGWVGWGWGLIATAILLPVTLTFARFLAVGSVAVAVASMMLGPSDKISVSGLALALAIAAVALSAAVGDRFVDGASYGDERRMLLRPPTGVAATAVPLAWALGFAAMVAPPILLATRNWLPAAIAAVVAGVIETAALRSLHQLSRRWLVFVPTGMVLHDLFALTEPVLFRRTSIERLGPAVAGTPARDLSLGAPGLLIECELTDPAPLGLVGPKRGTAEQADVRRFLVVPSRPGAVLDEADRRNIAVPA